MKRAPLATNVMVIVLILIVGVLIALHADAAEPAPAWTLVCAEPTKSETCRIQQQLFLQQKDKAGKEQNVGRILGLAVLYVNDGDNGKKRDLYLSIQMPLGVDLRPGAVLRVDKGKEIPVAFLRCTQAGCDASLKIDAEILKMLQTGTTLMVGFRPWGSAKVSTVNASLNGFTKLAKSLK